MRRFALALVAALGAGIAPVVAASASSSGEMTLGAPVPQPTAKIQAVDAILAQIKLPQGFKIALYALVPEARTMAVAPDGETVFVGTTGTKLYVLSDRAESGRAGEVHEVAAPIALRMPHGLCFAGRTLYVAEQNRVLAIDKAEAVAASDRATVTTIVPQGELIPRGEEARNHSARVCRVGPDDRLYIALGQPYNVPPKGKLAEYTRVGMGGIVSMNRDGGNRTVYANGIRNSVGLDFNPADKTLWFTDNQVDLMGDDIPPGEINRAPKAGLDFGFPWYGGGHTRTNEYKADTPPEDVVFPQVEMVAHAADLGMTFYAGSRFPARYRGGIFSAQHGSWNRTIPVGARVMFTPLRPDGTAAASEPFAEGWLMPNRRYNGRPVDVAPLPDGSLLVSDDYAGAIYRITYEGP